ncbi:MAG: LPS-assembly protein LptD [Thermodesulfobacteria bacterium]|nr:LPS-assembly protein LptD [Thermodesulfobacteriota bacterium]
MRLFRSIFILFLLSLAIYSRSYAKFVELSAKKFVIYNNPLEVIANGNVVIKTSYVLIWADEVIYHPKTQRLILLKFKIFNTLENIYIAGDKGIFNLRTGAFFSDRVFVYLKKYDLAIEAWDFKRSPIGEYTAKKALVTTCTLSCKEGKCSPPWDIVFFHFILTGKGLTSGKASEFRVKGIPVIYIPNFILFPKVNVPLLPYRKAGFLFPEVVHGSNLGWGVQLPYFLPLSDQFDVTFAPFYLEKHGFIWDLEQEFKFYEETRGIIKVRYLKDKTPEEGEKIHNWWLVGKINLFATQNTDAHLDIDLVSQKMFLEFFDRGLSGFTKVNSLFKDRFHRDITDKSQDYRLSRFWLQHYSSSLYEKLQSTYFDYHGDLSKDVILQPLFSAQMSLLPTRFLGDTLIYVNLYSLANYRKRGYYGERFEGNIGLKLPINLWFLMNSIELKGSTTFFHLQDYTGFSNNDIKNTMFYAKWNTQVIFYKNYSRFIHIIKPFITFEYRSKPKESELPIFTYEDTINSTKKLVTYGIWQFINSDKNPQLFNFKVYQMYDLTKKNDPLSNIYLTLTFNLDPYINLRYDSMFDVYDKSFVRHFLSTSFKDVWFDKIDFTYEYNPSVKTKQAIVSVEKTFFNKWVNKVSISKNLATNKLIEFDAETGWKYDCYAINVGYTQTPEEHTYWFRIELKGLGKYCIR